MTDKIKMIVGFSVGLLAGAGSAFVITRMVDRKKQEKAVESVKMALRRQYETAIGNREKKGSNEDEAVQNEEVNEVPHPVFEQVHLEGFDEKKKEKVNYSKMNEDLGYKGPDDEHYEAAPYLISEETYSEDRTYYDKVKMQYFDKDAMLVNEDEEYQDIPTTVGYQALDQFRLDDDLEEIYVRNDLISTDFYVVRCRTPISEVM